MKFVAGFALGLGLLLTTGCASSRSDMFVGNDSSTATSPSGLSVRSVKGGSSAISEIYVSDNCSAISRGGFIWLTDPVVLADLLSPLGADNSAQVMSKVNFESQGALMVDFGTMPTPDFKVKLIKDRLQLNGSKAIIQIDLVKPAVDGKRKVQVVSHPCALYVLPRVGYSMLEVQSELGDVFTSFGN